MGENKIEAKIEEFDIHLTKKPSDNLLNISGKVSVSFNCPSCYIKNVMNFVYGKDEMVREHKCELCSEEYLITLEENYPFKLRVGDIKEVELNRQMRPIIDKVKRGEFNY